MNGLEAISLVFGYIYMGCWSASFYPQPILNWHRKSTSGVNIDFPAINVLGFAAYFVYCYASRYSEEIRHEYALRNHGQMPLVPFNDLLFAGHAVVLTVIILSQFLFPRIWGFETRLKNVHGAKISRSIQGLMVGCVIGVAIVFCIVWARNDPHPKTGWAWLDVIYAISYVKLIITVVKYMPQVLTNYRNSSTYGWSIVQILLDLAGGILSNAQLLLDCYNQGDWSGITGNAVKLGLGNVSIFFDVIFIVQHYWLYAGARIKDVESEADPLLDSTERGGD